MRFCLITVVLLFAACAGTHPVHYYTLTSAQPRGNHQQPDGPTVLVGNIVAATALQDYRIRYRAGANEAGAYEYQHWTEQPGVMVRDALVQALRASGKYRRVMTASSNATGDYLVRGHLHAFHEVDNPSIQTRISVRLFLIDKKTNLAIWDHLFERDEPSSGKSMPDVVAAMDRNLGQVAQEAAAEMGQFLAARQ